ncbi:MAG: hypothetical protein ABSF53_01310, partial [Terracidiphilus sp.]
MQGLRAGAAIQAAIQWRARAFRRVAGLAAVLLTAFATRTPAQTFGGSNPITVSSTYEVSEGSYDVAMVLVPPSGSGLKALDLLSGICGFGTQQTGNSTFTMVNSGGSGTDNLDGMIPYLGGTCPTTLSGSYVPTDYFPGADVFSAPGPSSYLSGGIGAPGTTTCNDDFPSTMCGTYTFSTAFNLPTSGTNLNGTWTLYIANQNNNYPTYPNPS